jgi:hypothetical protein
VNTASSYEHSLSRDECSPNDGAGFSKGGFYHDGRFAELTDVLDHYDVHFGLGLSAQDKVDLAEYLKSI